MPEYNIHDPILYESQDTLERRYLAERIFNRLINESCPGVIGIYGSWGTGKTSLLNLIQERWHKSANQAIQIEHIDALNYEGTARLSVPVSLYDSVFPDHRTCAQMDREIHHAVNGLRQIGFP